MVEACGSYERERKRQQITHISFTKNIADTLILLKNAKVKKTQQSKRHEGRAQQ